MTQKQADEIRKRAIREASVAFMTRIVNSAIDGAAIEELFEAGRAYGEIENRHYETHDSEVSGCPWCAVWVASEYPPAGKKNGKAKGDKKS